VVFQNDLIFCSSAGEDVGNLLSFPKKNSTLSSDIQDIGFPIYEKKHTLTHARSGLRLGCVQEEACFLFHCSFLLQSDSEA